VAAIGAAVAGLAVLSAERVWSELKRILSAPDPVGAVGLMARLGVLAAVMPEGFSVERLAALVARGAPAEPMLRMAALLDGDAGAFGRRLRLSVAEQTRLAALRAGPVPGGDDSALRRLLAEEDAAVLVGRVWLADMPADESARVRARLSALPKPVFPLVGRDALALGARPGPAVGAALRRVRDWWVEGGCVAGWIACRDRLQAELGPN
jgi:poly(A) polymerase/tRNA nucleotidyltransferase (CCA-adding enzyme)